MCRIESGLLQDQDKRKDENPEIAKQVDEFILKLTKLKCLSSPFTMVYMRFQFIVLFVTI